MNAAIAPPPCLLDGSRCVKPGGLPLWADIFLGAFFLIFFVVPFLVVWLSTRDRGHKS